MTACCKYFVGEQANATFCGSGGMGDDIPSDPGMHGKVSLVVLHRIRPRVCCVQLVTSGRNVTSIGN